MTILFYRIDSPGLGGTSGLIDDAELRVWRPACHGLPPRGSRSPVNLAWWALTRLGLFARHDFAEVTLWRRGHRLHRLILTPRWYRFPFMDRDDLQIGDVWTAPEARGQGLATAVLGEALRHLNKEGCRVWYLVETGNSASIRLAEAAGMRLAGRGQRTVPLGLRAIGRFRLES